MAGEYRKLPGIRRNFVGYETLWMGPDHLLTARTAGLEERYRRYYYRDIQAVVIRRTRKAAAGNVIAAGGALLIFIWGLSAEIPAARLILWAMAAMFGLFFLYSLLWLGPAVDCHVITLGKAHELGMVNRLRGARRFLKKIRPVILAAQAEREA